MADWDEILSISPQAIDVRAIAGAPVLIAHDLDRTDAHVGVVVTARIENGVVVGDLKFSRRAEVDWILDDIADGVLRQTSCGYTVSSWRRQSGGAVPTFIATSWQPLEVSLLPLGADSECRIRACNLEAMMPDTVTVEPVEASKVQTSDWSTKDFASLVRCAEKLNVPATFIDGLRTKGMDMQAARNAIVKERQSWAGSSKSGRTIGMKLGFLMIIR